MFWGSVSLSHSRGVLMKNGRTKTDERGGFQLGGTGVSV